MVGGKKNHELTLLRFLVVLKQARTETDPLGLVAECAGLGS